MRKIWLQKPNSLEIWDLLPTDSWNRNNASPFLAIKGMGYKQEVTQNQVNTEYFISKILTKNQSITGIMYFQDDEHIKAFQEFVGDFREQLILYYSPSGEYEPYDRISAPFYKKVIISQMDKTEMDEFGWYQISTTLSTQDDVWNRDVMYSVDITKPFIATISNENITAELVDSVFIEKFGGISNIGETEVFTYNGTNWLYKSNAVDLKEYGITVIGTATHSDTITIQKSAMIGEPLVYPYTYPYTIGGRNVLSVDFNNDGREVGCVIKIKNNSESTVSQIEWFIEREYVDYYGNKHEHADVQKGKFNLDLTAGSELVIDSNPITQEAKVVYIDGTSQSVVDLQEPSWEYINFITIPHGKNRIVFYIDNAEKSTILFSYREQKEII